VQLRGKLAQGSEATTDYISWNDATEDHPQTSLVELPAFFLDSWPLKMGPTGCFETSVMNYHYSMRNNPEKFRSLLLSGGSLNSRISSSSLVFYMFHGTNSLHCTDRWSREIFALLELNTAQIDSLLPKF